MKNLGFFLGCFIFFFSFCQSAEPIRSSKSGYQRPATVIKDQPCELSRSQVVGYLDFVRCFPEASYCAHFLVPEKSYPQLSDLQIGTEVMVSGKFNLEGAATGRKYYYLREHLEIK